MFKTQFKVFEYALHVAHFTSHIAGKYCELFPWCPIKFNMAAYWQSCAQETSSIGSFYSAPSQLFNPSCCWTKIVQPAIHIHFLAHDSVPWLYFFRTDVGSPSNFWKLEWALLPPAFILRTKYWQGCTRIRNGYAQKINLKFTLFSWGLLVI